MNRILIDGDGCPVVSLCIEIAKKHNMECIVFYDTSHITSITGATIIYVSKGRDSVDFKLVNHLIKGDIVVTGDYGLASMVLSRGAICLNHNGLIYTNNNIDGLLFSRHENKKLLKNGKKVGKIKKRQQTNNSDFVVSLNNILKSQEI